MASRRKLKQTIKFVSNELISEIYFRCLMKKEIDELKVETLMADINKLTQEYILRVNHPDGKNNPQVTKIYFRKLYTDLQTAMDAIIKGIDGI